MIVEEIIDVDGYIIEEYDIHDLSLGAIVESWQTFEEAMRSLSILVRVNS